ncbi:MAG: substrate-binding domain-containing protein [Pseudomonadota bacterium]
MRRIRKDQGLAITRANVKSLLSAAALSVATMLGMSTPSFAEDDLRIIYVTPLSPGNAFAVPLVNGFETAGAQLDVDVTFRGNQDPNLWAAADAVKRMIENAVATEPDGLVISNNYPEALNESIQAAVDAGIPVVLSNAGLGEAENVGAMAYVGVEEYQLGEIGGQRLRELGAKNTLVVTVPPGIPLVDQRIDGFKAGMAPETATYVEVPVEALSDSTRLVNVMLAEIEKDLSIDSIFSIGSCCGPAMVAARNKIGDRADDMHFGTIDLGAPVLDALAAGEIDFAIDQQQFLQGYLPVVLLANYIRYGIEPADGIYRSGPALVTPENAEQVRQATERGQR